MCKINNSTEFENSNAYIGILDIAGFGKRRHSVDSFQNLTKIIFYIFDNAFVECLRINAFEQFCINYINERMQNYFIRTAILDEKHWYVKEGIDVPSIPYFDNTKLVGKFQIRSDQIISNILFD